MDVKNGEFTHTKIPLIWVIHLSVQQYDGETNIYFMSLDAEEVIDASRRVCEFIFSFSFSFSFNLRLEVTHKKKPFINKRPHQVA